MSLAIDPVEVEIFTEELQIYNLIPDVIFLGGVEGHFTRR